MAPDTALNQSGLERATRRHSPLDPPAPGGGLEYWHGLATSAQALAIAATARRHRGVTAVIADTAQRAAELDRDLRQLKDDTGLETIHFPDWETLPYDLFSPHPEILSARLLALARLPDIERGILVLPVATAMQRLCPTEYVHSRSLVMASGESLQPDAFRERLAQAGYEATDVVQMPGQFAVRGALLDVYPLGADHPYRIELFDEEIESIRTFEPESQRSIERVERIRILPGREYPFDEQAIDDFRRAFRNHFAVDTRHCDLYQDLRHGRHPQGLEYYLPLFFDHTATLFDYLRDDALLIQTGDLEGAAREFEQHVAGRYEQRRHDVSRPVLSPDTLFLDAGEFTATLARRGGVIVGAAPADAREVEFDSRRAPELPVHEREAEPAAALREFADQLDGRILLAADSAGRREVLQETLAAVDMRATPVEDWHAFRCSDARLAISVLPVTEGFVLDRDGIAVLTESQLFPGRLRATRRRSAGRDPDAVIRELTDLHLGAPVVHEEHGVGRYQGLSVIEVADHQAAEFLTLEYADGDKLYVPVGDLHLISRYTGGAPEQAPLHKLGGEQWARVKRRAARKIRDAAAELLDIYARREAGQGHAFPIDRKLYADFAATFPYEETPDQQQAIDAVLQDMASPRPMDRVVCGDVGFGKTEVALRAAFVAVQAGKQVAILAPTTLLARQHYTVCRDRFADWPVNVAMLSRLRGEGASKQTLAQLQDGSVDIVIGTHRLLQRGVGFKDLGLIVVDEEQRFGVKQKEQLKALRTEVDMLTLTATPIPRTLGMALSGIRDLSIIATPPARRMAIETTVSPWNTTLIREAVQRERQRGGQVFFLHNEVRSIDSIAARLREMFPEERIAVAHGQMRPDQLEQVMREFYAQRHHILVCTTIIENGLDVPTANTILINRADRFGLAQLHQLRGRVGRSHHRAFAYLLVPEWESITADARKRLEAITSLEDLGAGFTLASHDMEIRGAGELLGEEQSGQIQELGFDLHMDLLERAVQALREGREPELEQPLLRSRTVELHLPALIPEDYLPDTHTRLTLYKRISSAADTETLRDLQVEMIDRFGLLPDAVKNLFSEAEIKLRAGGLGIERLDFGPGGGYIDFAEAPKIDMEKLVALIQQRPDEFRLRDGQRLSLRADIDDDRERMDYLNKLLDTLES